MSVKFIVLVAGVALMLAAPAVAATAPYRTQAACAKYLGTLKVWRGIPLTSGDGIDHPIGSCFGHGESISDSRGETVYKLFHAYLIGNGHTFKLVVTSKVGGKWQLAAFRG